MLQLIGVATVLVILTPDPSSCVQHSQIRQLRHRPTPQDHRSTVKAVATSPEVQPWRYPCHGSTKRTFTQSEYGFLPARLSNAPPVVAASRDHLRAAIDDVIRMLRSTEQMVLDTSRALMKHFGGNMGHVRSLRKLPRIGRLRLKRRSRSDSTISRLRGLYEQLMVAAIFVHQVRADDTKEPSTFHFPKDDQLSRRLRLLEYGGHMGGRLYIGGLYSVLCRLSIVLTGASQLPDTSGLGLSVVAKRFKNPASTASRHNRDFRILKDVRHFVRQVRREMVRISRTS